jgi:hypothetical protein
VVSTPAVTQAASLVAVPTIKLDVCAWFLTTDGCRFGASCTRIHGVAPVKGSPEWIIAEKFMKKHQLTPTAEFSQ